jgi:hypothetical protein
MKAYLKFGPSCDYEVPAANLRIVSPPTNDLSIQIDATPKCVGSGAAIPDWSLATLEALEYANNDKAKYGKFYLGYYRAGT